MRLRSGNPIALAVLFCASLTVTSLWRAGSASTPGGAALPGETTAPIATIASTTTAIEPVVVRDAAAPPASLDDAARVRELARASLATDDSWRILQAVAGMTSTFTPESLHALSVLGSSNEDPEVRAAALAALREISVRHGDADGSIRTVLRALNAGVDTQIAELGQDLAAELDVAP